MRSIRFCPAPPRLTQIDALLAGTSMERSFVKCEHMYDSTSIASGWPNVSDDQTADPQGVAISGTVTKV